MSANRAVRFSQACSRLHCLRLRPHLRLRLRLRLALASAVHRQLRQFNCGLLGYGRSWLQWPWQRADWWTAAQPLQLLHNAWLKHSYRELWPFLLGSITWSLPPAHHSKHCSPLSPVLTTLTSTHHSILTTPYLPLPTHHSLLTTPRSCSSWTSCLLNPALHSLLRLTTLLTAPCSPLPSHYTFSRPTLGQSAVHVIR